MANSYREYLKMKKYGGEGGDAPSPTLISKTINANGLYLPEDDQADGYNSVSVNVPEVSDIAFVPPQKFKSNGSNLEDYKIFGSDSIVTETETSILPLTFTTTEDKLRDWEIRGNDLPGENLWNSEIIQGTVNSATGELIIGTNTRIRSATYSSAMLDSGTFTVNASGVDSAMIFMYDADYNYNRAKSSLTWMSLPLTFTIDAPYYYIVAFKFDDDSIINPSDISQVMLVKGSTAPDHYIPYQQGVGERTENKMPAPANGVYSANRTTVTVTDGVYHIVQTEGSGSSSVYIDLPEFEMPDSGYINYLNSAAYGNVTVVLRYKGTSLTGGYALTPINRAAAIVSYYAGKKVDQIQIYTAGNNTVDFTIAPMITNSNTYTAYIPYGYQIPLTVSQQGQTDKSYTFYIGDSPLTEGETVSKTSTGVDIELFEGENTISTTLYNKPETSVTYAESGVGEEVSGSYVIPIKINSTTTNVPIGDTPLMEDEYVSYAEQKIYRYVDGTLTPVDPPSALPQIATANGVNELSVETDIQPELVQIGLGIPVELIPTALGIKNITANDTYDASDDSLDGYSSVTVNVPEKVLTTKTITASGTYNAVEDQADGYSSVTVNVSSYNESWVNRIDFVITEVTS